jgi:hypothetical protein
VTAKDRLYYLASLQLRSETPVGGPKLARELIDEIEKAREVDGRVLNFLTALGRMPEAKEEISRCVDRLIERAPDPQRINFINAAESVGASGMRPLERVIKEAGDPRWVLHASQAYLHVLPEGTELDPELRDRMRSLFSSQSLRTFHGEALGANNTSPGAFAQTVGLYFGRFGTTQDLAWLESLPRLMNDAHNIRADYLARFREELAWECARAADAIRLRAR